MRGQQLIIGAQRDNLRALDGVALLNSLGHATKIPQEGVSLDNPRSSGIRDVEPSATVDDFSRFLDENRRGPITHTPSPVEQPEREAAADSASANGDEKSPLIKLITCVAKRTLTTARTTNASTEAPSARTPLICAARAGAWTPPRQPALSSRAP